MTKAVTWDERVKGLRDRLGRKPTLSELLADACQHELTPEEVAAQADSFPRGMKPTGDPEFDR